jgi:GrpB-like predicted nucleotidyltransferase (UPF0157 family)
MRRDPIVISAYDPLWPSAFENQRKRIEPVLHRWLARPIEHIGSTSIPGMPAKPIIDMVAVVHTTGRLEEAVDSLRALGWLPASEPGDAGPWRSFCTPSIARRTHHLHVVEESEDTWRELLAFREYLRAHPGLAGAYAALKRELASLHGGDPNHREPYRRGKAAFIREVTALALSAQSPNRSLRAQLHNITLYVNGGELDKVREFYAKRLGLPVVFEEAGHICCFGVGDDLAICVHEAEAGHPAGTGELFLWVEGVSGEVCLTDPAGNQVRLHQRPGLA